MLEWIGVNLGNIAVTAILAAAVILLIVKMIKDKKSGKSSCGCGCKSCAMKGKCYTDNK